MTATTLLRLTPLLACTLALSACYMPKPVSHAELDISASGQLTLDGRAISPQALPAAVQARHPDGARLVVDIRPSPAADITVINNAVHLLRQAHAAVAFAKADDAQP